MSKQVKQPEIPPNKPKEMPKAQLADKVKAMTSGSVVKKGNREDDGTKWDNDHSYLY